MLSDAVDEPFHLWNLAAGCTLPRDDSATAVLLLEDGEVEQNRRPEEGGLA